MYFCNIIIDLKVHYLNCYNTINMKKIFSITILILSFIFILAACNTFERCPTYTDATVETSSDKV